MSSRPESTDTKVESPTSAPSDHTIHRSVHAQNYTVLPNRLLRDNRITRQDRGLLAEILSRPPDWTFTSESLAEGEREGRHSLQASLRRLRDAGYVVLHRTRRPDGTTVSWYEVFDTPQATSDGPTSDGKPTSGVTRGNTASSQVTPEAGYPALVNPSPIRSTEEEVLEVLQASSQDHEPQGGESTEPAPDITPTATGSNTRRDKLWAQFIRDRCGPDHPVPDLATEIANFERDLRGHARTDKPVSDLTADDILDMHDSSMFAEDLVSELITVWHIRHGHPPLHPDEELAVGDMWDRGYTVGQVFGMTVNARKAVAA